MPVTRLISPNFGWADMIPAAGTAAARPVEAGVKDHAAGTAGLPAQSTGADEGRPRQGVGRM